MKKNNKKNEDSFEMVSEEVEVKEAEILGFDESEVVEKAEIGEAGQVSDGAGKSRSDDGKVLCSTCPELKEQLLRQTAEYDNYRKRTARERLELVPEITAGNVTTFLPILDNIERALAAECSDLNYKKGIEMVHESFVTALKALDVEEIVVEEFDPALHQAVQHVEHDELESGKVAQVFLKGYKIGSRIIRFAMVAIVK